LIDDLIYQVRLLIYEIRVGWYSFLKREMRKIQLSDDRLEAVSSDIADAVRHLKGGEGPRDRARAVEALETVYYERGDHEAAAQLAALYAAEFEDKVLCLEWHLKTVEAGGWWANYQIAKLLHGYDFEADLLERLGIAGDARHYYQLGVDRGHLASEIRLLELRRKAGEIGALSFYFQKIPTAVFATIFTLSNPSDMRWRIY
jgi:hypothetical protein